MNPRTLPMMAFCLSIGLLLIGCSATAAAPAATATRASDPPTNAPVSTTLTNTPPQNTVPPTATATNTASPTSTKIATTTRVPPTATFTPRPTDTAIPTATPDDCPVPPGKAGLLIWNYYGKEMNVSIANQDYKVPASPGPSLYGALCIVLTPGKYIYSANISGIGERVLTIELQPNHIEIQPFGAGGIR